ncbi:hypothetical protein IFM89_024915 [Coptis chinensis]|uniref:Uncharacterized protein n=1 Tax=Coptis chinensis TaxID=261450 RepID=A0A835IYB7_9MAGN|nr:hypothetical protein IFM89_024915 [Coptis chinensis]
MVHRSFSGSTMDLVMETVATDMSKRSFDLPRVCWISRCLIVDSDPYDQTLLYYVDYGGHGVLVFVVAMRACYGESCLLHVLEWILPKLGSAYLEKDFNLVMNSEGIENALAWANNKRGEVWG